MVDKKTIANMSIRIGADSSKLRQNLKGARRELGFFDKQAMSLKSTLVSLFAVTVITSYFKKVLSSYDIQAKAEAGLLTALQDREDILNRLKKQAADLQKQTLYGDERTIEAMGRLAQAFGTNEQAIKRLIPLVQDFATAKNMDLAASAELIAKTWNSSTNALSRYGIQVEGAARSEERLTSLVKNLSVQVEGQAASAAKAGTGGWKQFSNRLGDVGEKMGEFAVKSKEAGQALSDLNLLLDTISNISATFNTNQDSLISILWKESKRYNIITQGLKLTRKEFELFNKVTEKRIKTQKEQEGQENRYGVQAMIRRIEREKETKTIIQQTPILQQLQDKIKEIQEARDASLTEKDFAKYNRELNYYQEKLKKLNELGITKTAPAKPEVQMEKVDYEEELDPLWNFDEWDTMQAQWDAYLEDLNRRLTEWLENYAIEQQKIQAINNAIETSMEEMVGSVAGSLGELGATGKTNFASALLTPMADMAEQLGKLAIAEGLTIEAIKKSFSTLSGIGAIALGGALILVAKAVKSSVAAIGQGATASLNTSGPASYTNANASGPGIETITRNFGENNQLMRVEVFGKLSNNDIVFANKRGSEKLERIAG